MENKINIEGGISEFDLSINLKENFKPIYLFKINNESSGENIYCKINSLGFDIIKKCSKTTILKRIKHLFRTGVLYNISFAIDKNITIDINDEYLYVLNSMSIDINNDCFLYKSSSTI